MESVVLNLPHNEYHKEEVMVPIAIQPQVSKKFPENFHGY